MREKIWTRIYSFFILFNGDDERMIIKKMFLFFKKIVVSALIIYAYNSLAPSTNLFIPINIFNIFLVSFFGIVAMFELIVFSFFF